METVGILSVLEDEPYEEVKRLWRLFEERYNSRGVKSFDHPNITFQGGKTSKPKQLTRDFGETVARIKPFEIAIDGLGHFAKKVIYLKVKKNSDIIRINELVNQFLKNYCDQLFKDYYPKNWVPHVTLAMEDLTEKDFDAAWNDMSISEVRFKQTIHNICIVKQHSNGKIRIVKKYGL